MRHVPRLLATLSMLGILLSARAEPAMPPDLGVTIPFEKYVLENGLTLIVHEDPKAPIVSVNVWYHVGSKNEPPGKSGFAHLFEHLMFNGSEHFDDDYFQAMERVGATDLNGTTNEDRTNYFQNVPRSALDVALWMESDRMGHLLGAVTQEKLDEQRGVVQNEKRQGENQPYAVAYRLITENTYPEGHPYAHTVIGSMEDLEAASLEDVHEWFRIYYGAANAVVVVAGDVDAETVREKVAHYFGEVAPGPPLPRLEVAVAERSETTRQRVEDRVPHARIYKVWNVAPWGTPAAARLDLVTDVLGSGRSSRLQERLVYEDELALDAAAYLAAREIGSQLVIEATARPGVDLDAVERAIDEEVERFLVEGPTARELERVKTQFFSRFVRGIERIGGFGGKSDILAMSEVYGGRPDFYQVTLERVERATAESLRDAARRWMNEGVYILEIHPYPAYADPQTLESGVDRSELPEVERPEDPEFPEIERATLANGLEIVLAEMPSIPVVNFSLLFDAGYASDSLSLPGTAKLAMDMLDEGTDSMTGLEISEELALLGAELGTGSNLDMSNVFLSALSPNVGPSLDIMADVVLQPAFPEDDFERLKKLQLAEIAREKATPTALALRVMPGLLYGEGHPYAVPFTGSGTEDSVAEIELEDVREFHATWLHPENATLVVVGDTEMSAVLPEIEERFGDWPKGEAPAKVLPTVPLPESSVVYLLDRPDAEQSLVFAGHLAPPRANPEEVAFQTLNRIVGGSFTSRINLNLREDKHWSYGARSFLYGARGQRPFIAYAPVQSDKTAEAMQELVRELRGVLGPRPVSEEELTKAVEQQTSELAGSWETIGAVGSSISEIVRYGLRDNYYETYPDEVREMKLTEVSTAARSLLHPDKLTWVVVGDRSVIEAAIRELGIGDVRMLPVDARE